MSKVLESTIRTNLISTTNKPNNSLRPKNFLVKIVKCQNTKFSYLGARFNMMFHHWKTGNWK